MAEQQTIEYKQVWKDDYLKWICGFANAQGGVLVIGRNDAGEPVGVAHAGMIESWGRGIERIMQACAEAGVPVPEVSCDVNGLWMTFRFLPEHTSGSGHKEDGTTQETTQETIIKLIRSNPAITQKGLSDKTGLTVDGVKYHLKKLKDGGLIKRSGSTKAGNWEVLK